MAEKELYERVSGIYQEVAPLDLYDRIPYHLVYDGEAKKYCSGMSASIYIVVWVRSGVQRSVFRFLKTQGTLQSPVGRMTSPASSLFANRMSIDETATSIGNVLITQRNVVGDLVLRGRATGVVLSPGVTPVVSTAAHIVSVALPEFPYQVWFTLFEDIGCEFSRNFLFRYLFPNVSMAAHILSLLVDAIESGWEVTEMASIFRDADRDFLFLTPRSPMKLPLKSFSYPSPADVKALAPTCDKIPSPSAKGPYIVALSFSGKPTLAQALAEYEALMDDVKEAIPPPSETDLNAIPASVTGSQCVASSGKYVGYLTRTYEMMLCCTVWRGSSGGILCLTSGKDSLAGEFVGIVNGASEKLNYSTAFSVQDPAFKAAYDNHVVPHLCNVIKDGRRERLLTYLGREEL
ncbi:hypothetical protein BDK51DRAFT_41027 [Blyttiomyces helicus]|uniref:Uncharacterized protein n=1 Tax=Blyttiomyces helicus TaxID=388810 RepID=A0A4P9WIE0_9FUNG|nr:hypothetical protein BDK51DRAFT_41027 [Blyttiomyces helicus]|eukprot:RKO91208.1 hypothetical protein BDK51DRAFT_41027 [Blyttiomyces helicus]